MFIFFRGCVSYCDSLAGQELSASVVLGLKACRGGSDLIVIWKTVYSEKENFVG